MGDTEDGQRVAEGQALEEIRFISIRRKRLFYMNFIQGYQIFLSRSFKKKIFYQEIILK